MFSISKICIHLIPPREIAYIVTVIKKEWHEIQSYQTQGINGSTLQVTGLLVFILQKQTAALQNLYRVAIFSPLSLRYAKKFQQTKATAKFDLQKLI